jgi:undecaprenyl diphosphate synthase
MDGNRRWARAQGLPTLEGHRRGYEKLRDVQEWCKVRGIRHLAVYALSTENWNRSTEEVTYLMDLIRVMLADFAERARVENAVHVVGDLARFPLDIQKSIADIHARNRTEATEHLWVAASYGGRAEILAAARALVGEGGEVTDERFVGALWSADMPDLDLIIRTGGEQRLSNFFPWQSTYSELFFPSTYWPAFTEEEFQGILDEYAKRERRHGT